MVRELRIFPLLILVCVFVSACTSTLDPTGSPATAPQPIADASQIAEPETPPTLQAGQPENAPSASALASQSPPNAAANVTDNQLADPPQVAALPTQKSFAFLPLEGAPGSKAQTFSKSLEQAAERHSLLLLPHTRSASANYRVKGYFSALSDGTGTRLVYIWDVTDPSGKRLHRINGEAKNSVRSAEAWNAIGNAELTRVAEQTALQLKSWVSRR